MKDDRDVLAKLALIVGAKAEIFVHKIAADWHEFCESALIAVANTLKNWTLQIAAVVIAISRAPIVASPEEALQDDRAIRGLCTDE